MAHYWHTFLFESVRAAEGIVHTAARASDVPVVISPIARLAFAIHAAAKATEGVILERVADRLVDDGISPSQYESIRHEVFGFWLHIVSRQVFKFGNLEDRIQMQLAAKMRDYIVDPEPINLFDPADPAEFQNLDLARGAVLEDLNDAELAYGSVDRPDSSSAKALREIGMGAILSDVLLTSKFDERIDSVIGISSEQFWGSLTGLMFFRMFRTFLAEYIAAAIAEKD